MNLIIVESPTKAKTILKFLGKGYKVESSFGHVRDLPKSELGIDVDNDFQPRYVIPTKARKTVSKLKAEVKKSDKIVLATDEDREGEAIAWHLTQALGLNEVKNIEISRIVFHEITKNAIDNALEKPREINKNLVDAQQARRALDRIVGYKLSPFLWKKIARRLSAGRVQSVAVRLIVEREEEIRKFKPEEYHSITAQLETQNSDDGQVKSESKKIIEANLRSIDGKVLGKLDIKTKKEADKFVADLNNSLYKIVEIDKKETARRPRPPFITSTLQQAAANRLGFSAKKTMFLAQQLYENGYITYMRTDSSNLSAESVVSARKWLTENLGNNYAVKIPRKYKAKSKGAQEAHEAIRPTDPFKDLEKIKLSDSGRIKLYELIWRRFMASQMPDAKVATASVDILAEQKSSNAKKYILRATGQRIVFDGFLKIWKQKLEERELPELSKGDGLDLKKIDAEQHFTEPPPRYNEASLVKTLEKLGIGRPSTYAPIISVIQDRNYAVKDSGRFQPTQMGEIVNGMLVKNFPDIVDVNFTAEMEDDLDKVADGKKEWQKVIGAFYKPFIKNLNKRYETVEAVKKPEPEKTDEKCDKCGKEMVIRQGRFGRFVACSGFPDCKNTKKLDGDDSKKPAPKSIGVKCPRCKEGEVVQRFARKTRRPFWGCSSFPKCRYITWEKPNANKD